METLFLFMPQRYNKIIVKSKETKKKEEQDHSPEQMLSIKTLRHFIQNA